MIMSLFLSDLFHMLLVTLILFFFFFLAAPTACGSSRTRDLTCDTAATQATAVATPHT